MVKVPVLPFVNRPEFVKHPRWPTPMVPAKQPRQCAICGCFEDPKAGLGEWICGIKHTPQEVEEAMQRGQEERNTIAAKHPESPEG